MYPVLSLLSAFPVLLGIYNGYEFLLLMILNDILKVTHLKNGDGETRLRILVIKRLKLSELGNL